MPYDNNPTAKMGPYHMESAKQEKENLMKDNPVARTAAGNRPWISKHFKSSMSPLKDMHSRPADFNPELVEEANDPKSTMNPKFKKEVLKAAGEAAGKAGAKVVKKVYKKKQQRAV